MTSFETIKTKLSEKETEDLLAIWKKNNRNEWTDEAFDAIHQILTERGIKIPKQETQSPSVSNKNKNKTGKIIGLGSLIAYAFGMFIADLMPDSTFFNIITSVIAGALIGLIPYFIAKERGHAKFSKASLIVCAIFGVIFGFLGSALLAGVLTIITLSRKKITNLKNKIQED